jgi:hypothetical protein
MPKTKLFNLLIAGIVTAGIVVGGVWVKNRLEEARVLREIVERLSADTRVAEVLVTKSEFDETTKRIKTTIKFLEYDAKGKPLDPKFFTFYGNLIQFQSLIVRFEDQFVRAGDRLRGKSAYLFLKAFVLDGERTQVFDITDVDEIPRGYRVSGPGKVSEFEERLWRDFWRYAVDPRTRKLDGVKSAQIEAPGSMFLPGTIYTLKIEHPGGLRIDTAPIPEILKGEKISP